MSRLLQIAGGIALTTLGSIFGHGCSQPVFQCGSDSDCNGLYGAQCEASGFCSVPASRCPSGREYGLYAGQLSGQCVNETSGTDASSGSDSGQSSTAGSASSASTTLPSTTGDNSASSTTSPASASQSTTDPTASTSIDPSAGSTGDTGFGLCGGAVLIHEEFEAFPPPAGVWEIAIDGDATGSVENGNLVVGIDIPPDSTADAAWLMRSVASIEGGGVAGFEIESAPDVDSPGVMFVGFGDGTASLGIYAGVLGGDLATWYLDPGDVVTVVSSTPFSLDAHRWVRMRFDAEFTTLVAQSSADGDEWETFDVLSPEITGIDGFLEAGAGAIGGPFSDPAVASFDNVFLCASE